MRRSCTAVVAIFSLAVAPVAPAEAITAELAKKCRDLSLKAYPYQQAGHKAGTAREQRDYFNRCVSSGGNMESAPTQPAPKSAPPNIPH
jgi:hypothetical protein